jgi:phosphohistidine phosphatase
MAQFVFLIHHADAVPGAADANRPLSDLGLSQADSVANQARARGATPSVIWHSGKLRARQTADAWLRIANSAATIAAVDGLQPDDNPEAIATALELETRDLAVVSHMPLLPMLLHRLTTGRRDLLSSPFPLNGCVALERRGAVCRERWRVGPDRGA